MMQVSSLSMLALVLALKVVDSCSQKSAEMCVAPLVVFSFVDRDIPLMFSVSNHHVIMLKFAKLHCTLSDYKTTTHLIL